MAGWHLGQLMPFDVESTGVSVDNDLVVTATVAHIRPGEATQVSSWLIAVDIDIPAEATAIHGITTDHARANGKPAAEVLDLIAGELALGLAHGVPLVGMNCVYDLTILDRELRRHGLPTLEDRLGRPIGPVIDVFVLDKALEPYRGGKRKLTDLCRVYGVKIDGAHNAEFDALAAARVAYRIGQRASMTVDELCDVYRDRRRPTEVARNFEQLGRLSLDELHAAQIKWRRAQCDSLRDYFNSRRQAHDGVPGDWPLIPYREAA